VIFDRQIPCWGVEGQEILSMSSVFVAGAGGLGCLVSEILVRAGVGTVFICDREKIDGPDLNRQLLYVKNDIGKKKAETAKVKLSSIHGLTSIHAVNADILDSGFTLPGGLTAIADCLDNYKSRFALWDRCPEGVHFIHGGMDDFYGQVLTLQKGGPHDLKKIFSGIRLKKGGIPANGGSSSVVSSIQAYEVLKTLILGPGLLNTILVIDLSDYTFSKINLN